MLKSKRITAIALSCFLLTACGHKNPLMEEKYIHGMAANFMFDHEPNMPIKMCARFYAGVGNPKDQEKCDVWSASYFKSLKIDFPLDTELSDFRDKEFWKAVLASWG